MESNRVNTGTGFPVLPARQKRKKAFSLAILAVLACLLLFSILSPREPLYQGRSLSSWLSDLGRSFDQGGGKAAEAIRSIGTNALPYLITALKAKDSKIKVKFADLSRGQNLIRLPFRMADEYRDAAVKALFVLGPEAKNAIPDVSRMLDNPEFAKTAETALFAIGTNSIPALVASCSHTNRSVRVGVAFVLSKLTGRGGYTTQYTPAGSTNLVYRLALTIGDDDIASLTANLNHARPAVRCASAEALIGYSAIAQSAVPALVKALRDEDQGVREKAAEALKRISPEEATKAGVQ